MAGGPTDGLHVRAAGRPTYSPSRSRALGHAWRFSRADAYGMQRIMSNWPIICAACVALLALVAAAVPAAAANACIFDWAVPGTYEISGDFRGRTETVSARLTHDCKVRISLPGVFTGGPLRRQGRCLAFSFRVEGERRAFTAQWCGSYGVVPWQGRNVRASIARRQERTIIQSR